MQRSRSPWLPAVLAGALVAALFGGLAASPGEEGRSTGGQVSCDGRTPDGEVTVLRRPVFPAPPVALVEGRRGHLVDLALERTEGQRAWLTDGWSIARTDDAGCSWDVVFSLDDLGSSAAFEPQTSAIVALATPSLDGPDLVYALVQDLSFAGTSARFTALVSDDAGANFFLRGSLGPVNLGADADACGHDTTCDLVPTHVPNTVYVRFATPDRTVIHRSTDQGQSFDARNAATEFGSISPNNGISADAPILTDLAIDPGDVNRMWGTSVQSGPSLSQDGGRSFTKYEPFERFELPLEAIRHVEMASFVDRASSLVQPLVVVVGEDASGVERVAWSSTGGEEFHPFGQDDAVAGRTTGLAVTDRLGVVVASTSGMYVKSPGGVQRRVAGLNHPNVRDLQAVHSFGATSFAPDLGVREPVWGLNDQEVVIVEVAVPDPDVSIDLGDLDGSLFDPLSVPDLVPGRLLGPDTVNMAVGQVLDLSYVLDVPPVPTSVDVFFLLDETGSMQDEFDALALGIDRIASDLKASGIDVAVGLGTYGNGFRYHRYRQIGPVDDQFRSRLSSIRAGGDGEVAYTGISQVITGSGLQRSRAGNGVRAGQDAEWRDNTIRMIVHATDEGLSEEPEGPTRQQVHSLLAQSGVKHLGLIANEVAGGVATVYDWDPMFDLARVSGALAPAGPDGDGIDCDRDGFTDIEPGDPIACYLSPLTTNRQISELDRADLIPDLAAVIVNMLEAETLNASVTYHHSSSRLLAGFIAAGRSTANFRNPVILQSRARALCTESIEGVTERVTLTATSGTRVLAARVVDLACGVGDPTPALALLPAPLAPAVVVQPAAPPAPVQAPSLSQGAVQSTSVASSNSLVTQAGAAAAQQEQHQVQAAGIGRDEEAQPGIAYEFSARRDRSQPAHVTLGAGALLAAGAALALRRQRQDVRSRVFVRRDH